MGNDGKNPRAQERMSRGRVEFPENPGAIEFSVAVGIIEKDGKFFSGKRPADKVYGGKWEFVGGKIKEGEMPEFGLAREIKEELGVSVEEVSPYLEWDYRFPDGNLYHLFAFRCRVSGDFEMRVHEDMGWFTPEELKLLDFIESDKALIDRLINEKRNK